MIASVSTRSRTELVDVTSLVHEAVSSSGVNQGLCVLYVPHTTAAVTVNESADPSVREDILMVLNRIVPWEAGYRHAEGNSAAHVKATLVGPSQAVPIEGGRLTLGTWQGIFFCEFDGPRTRKMRIDILPQAPAK